MKLAEKVISKISESDAKGWARKVAAKIGKDGWDPGHMDDTISEIINQVGVYDNVDFGDDDAKADKFHADMVAEIKKILKSTKNHGDR